ncbi:hypothetical protein BN130_1241 [Cronobacter malonaticus 507]|nr:hypothetical protein BN130_1241 [Cronobacter malonaticus 507]
MQRLPELPRGGDGLLAAGDDNGLGMARQHLFAAHLRPGNGAVGEDILAAARRDDFILDRGFAGGKKRAHAELQKHALFRLAFISRRKRLPALFQLARRSLRFFRRRAVRGERAQRVGHLRDILRIEPEHMYAERFELVYLPLRVAAAPGDQQIGFKRRDTLHVHPLPVRDLFELTRGVGVVRVSARLNRRNAGGKGKFGIGGGEGNDPRRGKKPRRENQQGDKRPVKPAFSHGSGS